MKKIFFPSNLCNEPSAGFIVGWITSSSSLIVIDIVGEKNIEKIESQLSQLNQQEDTFSTSSQSIVSLKNSSSSSSTTTLNDFQNFSSFLLYHSCSSLSIQDEAVCNNIHSKQSLLALFKKFGLPTVIGEWKQKSVDKIYYAKEIWIQMNSINDLVLFQLNSIQSFKFIIVLYDLPKHNHFYYIHRELELQDETNHFENDLKLLSFSNEIKKNFNPSTSSSWSASFVCFLFYPFFCCLSLFATWTRLSIKLLCFFEKHILSPFQTAFNLEKYSHFITTIFEKRKHFQLFNKPNRKHSTFVQFLTDNLSLENFNFRCNFDVFLGMCTSLILFYGYFQSPLEWSLAALDQWLTNDVLRQMIYWIMRWPAGFKLNHAFASFLGALFVTFLDWWQLLMTLSTFLDVFLSIAFFVVVCVGPLGLSLQLALLVDLINLFTLHIRCFFLFATRLYRAQWSVLASFWNLFRGRKHNPLKQRIDTCDYDVEQLLVGTVLFTTLVFLFPTMAFFYVCFSSVALLLALLRAAIHVVRHLVMLLPYYSVLLRLIDARQLPHGVVIQTADNSSESNITQLTSSYMPFSMLFTDMKEEWNKTSKQLSLATIVIDFLKGKIQ